MKCNKVSRFPAERQRRYDDAEAASSAAVVGRVHTQALRTAEELRGQERRGKEQSNVNHLS